VRVGERPERRVEANVAHGAHELAAACSLRSAVDECDVGADPGVIGDVAVENCW